MKDLSLFGLMFFCLAMQPAQAKYDESDLGEQESFHKISYFYHKFHPSHREQSSRQQSRTLLAYHNGATLHSSTTAAIFWGSEWQNAAFAGDKITGLDSFFYGFTGSSYANTSTEYYDSAGQITGNSAYLGHSLDTSEAPSKAITVAQAVAETCKMTANNPNPNAIYFIYTSTHAGNVNYCAWHSWGSCSNGAKVQVAYMPNIDGEAGCDPGDTSTGHSQGLAAVANVTSHELLEGITDTRGSGWYDSSGYENGDKCAWSFPPGSGLSTFSNGTQWKLQMEWSNYAYSRNVGYSNLSAQKGCIY